MSLRLFAVAIWLGLATGCVFLTKYDDPIPLSGDPVDLQGTVTSQTVDWLIRSQADPADLHFDFTFTAGPAGVAEGGGLKVMLGHVLPTTQQIYTPFSLTGPSVYFFKIELLDDVVATCSNPDVKLKVHEPSGARSLRDMFRYIKYKRSDEGQVSRDSLLRQADNEHAIVIEVKKGALAAGDTITVRVGKKGGLPGPTLEGSYDIVTRLDGDGDGVFGLLADAPSFDSYSKVVAAAQLVAPSTMKVGETSHMVLRVEDDYFTPNLARFEAGQVVLEPIAGLTFPQTIDLDGSFESWDGATTEHAVTAGAPGVYRISGTATIDGKVLPVRSNPIVVTDDPAAPGIYFGDTHLHSILSYDADRPPAYVYWRQRHEERHDFAFLSDHDMIGSVPFAPKTGIAGRTPDEWAYARSLADENYVPGQFVTLYAYEWTSYYYGHRNIYFAPTETDPPLWHHNHPSEYGKPDEQVPGELVEHLEGHEFMAIPHSTAWPTGAGSYYWGLLDDDPHGDPAAFPQQKLLELYSTHGTSEYFDNEYAVDKGHPEAPTKSKLVKKLLSYDIQQAESDSGNFAQDALADGWRLGFIGSSDQHYLSHIDQAYKQGYAAVVASSLTREGIWDAMVSRRTFATTGVRILVDFAAGEAPMGSTIHPDGPVAFTGEVHGTGPLDIVQIVEFDGTQWVVAYEQHYGDGTEDATVSWTDEAAAPGRIWYLRIRQHDGNRAWTSAIWAEAP